VKWHTVESCVMTTESLDALSTHVFGQLYNDFNEWSQKGPKHRRQATSIAYRHSVSFCLPFGCGLIRFLHMYELWNIKVYKCILIWILIFRKMNNGGYFLWGHEGDIFSRTNEAYPLSDLSSWVKWSRREKEWLLLHFFLLWKRWQNHTWENCLIPSYLNLIWSDFF
jgi:hypothetical protein